MLCSAGQNCLQPGVDVARTAAFGSVAGHVFKFTFLVAAWTGIGRGCSRKKEAAFTAFPVSKSATGTKFSFFRFRYWLTAVLATFFITVWHGFYSSSVQFTEFHFYIVYLIILFFLMESMRCKYV
jgi:hypothetical protein